MIKEIYFNFWHEDKWSYVYYHKDKGLEIGYEKEGGYEEYPEDERLAALNALHKQVPMFLKTWQQADIQWM